MSEDNWFFDASLQSDTRLGLIWTFRMPDQLSEWRHHPQRRRPSSPWTTWGQISASCDDDGVFACFWMSEIPPSAWQQFTATHWPLWIIRIRPGFTHASSVGQFVRRAQVLMMVNLLDGDAVEFTRRFSPIYTATRAAWGLKLKATCDFWNIPSALFASVTMETMPFVSLMRQDFTDSGFSGFLWNSEVIFMDCLCIYTFYRIWLINNKLDVIYRFSVGKHHF